MARVSGSTPIMYSYPSLGRRLDRWPGHSVTVTEANWQCKYYGTRFTMPRWTAWNRLFVSRFAFQWVDKNDNNYANLLSIGIYEYLTLTKNKPLALIPSSVAKGSLTYNVRSIPCVSNHVWPSVFPWRIYATRYLKSTWRIYATIYLKSTFVPVCTIQQHWCLATKYHILYSCQDDL